MLGSTKERPITVWEQLLLQLFLMLASQKKSFATSLGIVQTHSICMNAHRLHKKGCITSACARQTSFAKEVETTSNSQSNHQFPAPVLPKLWQAPSFQPRFHVSGMPSGLFSGRTNYSINICPENFVVNINSPSTNEWESYDDLLHGIELDDLL